MDGGAGRPRAKGKHFSHRLGATQRRRHRRRKGIKKSAPFGRGAGEVLFRRRSENQPGAGAPHRSAVASASALRSGTYPTNELLPKRSLILPAYRNPKRHRDAMPLLQNKTTGPLKQSVSP